MAKIILITHDVVGEKMAGPAIRYWEMAKVLAKSHQVVLFCSKDSRFTPHPSFEIHHLNFSLFTKCLKGAQAIVGQCLSPSMILHAKKNNVRVVLDAYAPEFIEHWEIFRDLPDETYNNVLNQTIANNLFYFSHADHIICANERQKALWLGVLAGRNKIIPSRYKENNKLNNLISIIPFGISSEPPVKNGPGLATQLGLPASSKVILWGGGVWNWFDPLTLIKSINLLGKKRSDIHLIFMGIKHPNDTIPEMQMTKEAIQLAKHLKLEGKHVHFNFGWIPYNERQNTLLEGHLGVSCHFDTLETHFSFRTRILDYLWAEFPIITTEGDVFSDFIKKEQIGLSVPYKDPQALAEAIEKVVDDPVLRKNMSERIRKVKTQFYWDQVLKPLETILTQPYEAKTTFQKWIAAGSVVTSYATLKGLPQIGSKIISKIFSS